MSRRRAMATICWLASAWTTHAAAGQTMSAPLEVRAAWIRWLPAGLPAAGYAVLYNRTNAPVVLVGAESTEFARTMIHRSLSSGGLERMLPVARLAVPARGSIRLSPGGYHLMLIQPRRPVVIGAHVEIRLTYANGRSQTVEFVVRPANATGPH